MQQIHTGNLAGYVGHQYSLTAGINPFHIWMCRQAVDG